MITIPQITQNQMEFMRSKKKSEIVRVNGLVAEIQPLMFTPVSPYSYSTRVLLDNMHFEKGERVIEIGTGCGILSVFAAKQGARVDGVDILSECVEFSLRNAIKNDVFKQTRFYYSDMFSNVDGKYDTIICNLPILEGDLPNEDPAWYSLFDPNFSFHKQLFSEGRKYAPKIQLAHADIAGKEDFTKLENLANKYGWNAKANFEKYFAQQKWRNYEFTQK